MHKTEASSLQLEILIATMNRNSLDFLDAMFQNNPISDYQILIINQTSVNNIIESNEPKIRIINSYDKGLSKSRNLALEHAIGDIVLIADDDLVYVEGFQESILKAFNSHTDAALISFQILTKEGKSYRPYPAVTETHSNRSIEKIMSVEIALNLKIVQDRNIKFDINFGLGSHFETAEEYIFAREVMRDGLNTYFYNECIASHPQYNSGQDAASDTIIYARAALHYRLYHQIAYFWLSKYLFYLLRHNYIQFKDLKQKFSIGLKGIHDYKSILRKVNA